MTLSVECILLITGIVLLTWYEYIVLKRFGIPVNLSITYYHYERRCKGMGFMFPFLLLYLCCVLGPIWITTTLDASILSRIFIIFPYITILCLLMVALSARYNRNHRIFRFHYACAIIASISAVLWIFLVAYRIVYVGLAILATLLLTGIYTGTLKKCTLFWLETAGFYALLVTLLFIHLIPIKI